MRLMDLFRIAEGNLSILGVMIGDDFNEQRDRLIKEGMTSETWVLNKGSILINPETGVYTRYLKEAIITLEGVCINKITFQADYSSYPNDVADSFLGIAKEMEKFGVSVIKPNWQVLDDRIVNQYRTHNALWDVKVNVTISGFGRTSISLELSANMTDGNSQITEDAVGVYKSLSKLTRRNWQLEDYRHKSDTIVF
jgi:hypothetical protein